MKSILGFRSFGLSVSRSVAVVSLIDPQQAKKFVDFAIGLMIFALNLPDRQVLFFLGKFKSQKDCNQSC